MRLHPIGVFAHKECNGRDSRRNYSPPSPLASRGLYELLTGKRPYQLATGAGSATELHAALIAIEIGLPSDAAIDADAATMRGTTPAGLRRELAGDLDAIVGKALMKDAALRYESAEAMAADLERHLRHE